MRYVFGAALAAVGVALVGLAINNQLSQAWQVVSR